MACKEEIHVAFMYNLTLLVISMHHSLKTSKRNKKLKFVGYIPIEINQLIKNNNSWNHNPFEILLLQSKND